MRGWPFILFLMGLSAACEWPPGERAAEVPHTTCSPDAGVDAPSSGSRGPAVGGVRFPPDIPEQPLIRTIYSWCDQIAVVTERYLPAQSTYTYGLGIVDRSGSRIVPFSGLTCDAYHDVAYSEAIGKLLVCGNGDSARLFQLRGDFWNAQSESFPGQAFRVAVDGDRIALVSETFAYLMSASSTTGAIRIPIEFTRPHLKPAPPTALLFDEHSLLVGYDRGEYGGGLFRLDLNRPDLPPSTILNDGVSVLVRSKSGTIWAAAGIAHLGTVAGTLYRIRGDVAEVVAAVSGVHDGHGGTRDVEKSGVELPGLTEISALALSTSDNPIVALPQFGLFAVVADKFVGLYERPLTFFYQMPRYGVQSLPIGLAVNAAGEMYVASRSLGVFLLHRTNDRFGLEQMVFEDSR